MKLSTVFLKIRLIFNRVFFRRKKHTALDFEHVNEHMRRDLGYYNGDRTHRVHDQDLRAHHPFNRGP